MWEDLEFLRTRNLSKEEKEAEEKSYLIEVSRVYLSEYCDFGPGPGNATGSKDPNVLAESAAPTPGSAGGNGGKKEPVTRAGLFATEGPASGGLAGAPTPSPSPAGNGVGKVLLGKGSSSNLEALANDGGGIEEEPGVRFSGVGGSVSRYSEVTQELDDIDDDEILMRNFFNTIPGGTMSTTTGGLFARGPHSPTVLGPTAGESRVIHEATLLWSPLLRHPGYEVHATIRIVFGQRRVVKRHQVLHESSIILRRIGGFPRPEFLCLSREAPFGNSLSSVERVSKQYLNVTLEAKGAPRNMLVWNNFSNCPSRKTCFCLQIVNTLPELVLEKSR